MVPVPDDLGVLKNLQAWPTGVPGLVVAQVCHGAPTGCLGTWSVIHARSGKRPPYCLPDPEAALGLALVLRGVTDWQQPGETARRSMKTPAYRAAVAPYLPWRCRHGERAGPITQDNGVIA